MTNTKHSDCTNFSPIDVAKGICRLCNELIFIDTDTCGSFDRLPKCNNCSNFKEPNTDDIGTCEGFKKTYWTHGELNAMSCEGYCIKA